MEKTQRDLGVDIAKALGIFMVVFCHANFAPLSPFRFFHMSLFFFLTGWLSSFRQDFRVFLTAKVRHLYLPFVICEVLFLLLHNVLFVRAGMAYEYGRPLWKLLLHISCFDNVELMLSPLWFLPALFFVNILCYALVNVFRDRRRTLLAVSIAIMLVGLLCGRHSWLLLHSQTFSHGIGVVLVAQFFCVCGWLLRQLDFHFDKWYIALAALCYLYAAKLFFGLSVDMRINYYSNVGLWLLSVVAGVYFTMWLSSQLLKVGTDHHAVVMVLSYIGRKSLVILMLHIFCFKLVELLQVHCFGYDISLLPLWENLSKAWYWSLAYSFAGIAIPLLLCLLSDAVTSRLRKGINVNHH